MAIKKLNIAEAHPEADGIYFYVATGDKVELQSEELWQGIYSTEDGSELFLPTAQGSIGIPLGCSMSIGFTAVPISGIVMSPAAILKAESEIQLVIPSNKGLYLDVRGKDYLNVDKQEVKQRRFNSGRVYEHCLADYFNERIKEHDPVLTRTEQGFFPGKFLPDTPLDVCKKFNLVYINQVGGGPVIISTPHITGNIFQEVEGQGSVFVEPTLEELLDLAVSEERYEDAASLREEISKQGRD